MMFSFCYILSQTQGQTEQDSGLGPSAGDAVDEVLTQLGNALVDIRGRFLCASTPMARQPQPLPLAFGALSTVRAPRLPASTRLAGQMRRRGSDMSLTHCATLKTGEPNPQGLFPESRSDFTDRFGK